MPRKRALSDVQVKKARWYYYHTDMCMEEIARRFKVTGPTMSRAIYGEGAYAGAPKRRNT